MQENFDININDKLTIEVIDAEMNKAQKIQKLKLKKQRYIEGNIGLQYLKGIKKKIV